MYHYNDFEAWRQYRDELLQEAGERRLARKLRTARSSDKNPDVWRWLLGLVAGLYPRSRKMAGL